MIKKNWKEEDFDISQDKEAILNGIEYNEVSDIQQMIYHALKKSESLDDILDAVVNIKDNPPEIPRMDQIEAKINELIDWTNSLPAPFTSGIEKLPE